VSYLRAVHTGLLQYLVVCRRRLWPWGFLCATATLTFLAWERGVPGLWVSALLVALLLGPPLWFVSSLAVADELIASAREFEAAGDAFRAEHGYLQAVAVFARPGLSRSLSGGPISPRAGAALAALGDFLARAGRLREAESFLVGAVTAHAVTPGQPSLAFARALTRLGALQLQLHRFEEARASFQAARECCSALREPAARGLERELADWLARSGP